MKSTTSSSHSHGSDQSCHLTDGLWEHLNKETALASATTPKKPASPSQSKPPSSSPSIHCPAPLEKLPMVTMSAQGNSHESVLTPGTDGEPRMTTHTNGHHRFTPSGPTTLATQDRYGQHVSIDLTHSALFSSKMAEDIHDWLEVTGWHDLKYRNDKLASYRLEALEKEQAAIESKRAQIMLGYHMDDNARMETPTPQITMAKASPAAHRHQAATAAPTSNKMDPNFESGYGYSDGSYYKSAKEEEEQDEYATALDQPVHVASYRAPVTGSARNRSGSPRYVQEDTKYRNRDYSRSRERRRSIRIPLPPRPNTSRSLESRVTRRGDYGRPGSNPFLQRREYREAQKEADLEKRDWDREMKNFGYPKELNLGSPGDTCFFVIKSYSYTNIYDSQDEGVWATQVRNEGILSRAFTNYKTVVLFFSVNASHAFQGYAVMKSLPGADVRRPRWYDSIKFRITEPFEVDWASKMHCDDICVRHVPNSLNDNLPCSRGRDCQEVDEAAGRQMVAIFEARATREVDKVNKAKRSREH